MRQLHLLEPQLLAQTPHRVAGKNLWRMALRPLRRGSEGDAG